MCKGGRWVCVRWMVGWNGWRMSDVGGWGGRWEVVGFSTYSLWSRAGGPHLEGLAPGGRSLPHPGVTAAPCPPRWRIAQTRPSGWAADCQGRPGRWEPQARTQTCKRSAPLPPMKNKRQSLNLKDSLWTTLFYKKTTKCLAFTARNMLSLAVKYYNRPLILVFYLSSFSQFSNGSPSFYVVYKLYN